MDYFKNQVAAHFAGALATEYYMPQQHRPSDAQFDNGAVDGLFAWFKTTAARRFEIEKAGKIQARALVAQEREAILGLTQALVDGDGSLTGEEASRIVKEHLSGGTAPTGTCGN